MQDVLNRIYEYIAMYGLRVMFAVIILVVGWWLARLISRMIGNLMGKAHVESTLIKFVQNLCYIGLMTYVIIAAISKLGIDTTSLAVVIGAAGLAVGFALQGSLSNFAAGVMLIIFKPFKVGDYIEAGGKAGSVQEIQIFNTVLHSPDNVRIIVPNGQITGGSITNYSANATRRVDLIASISYESDMQKARQILQQIVSGDSRVLPSPAPTIAVCELAESSVDFVVRPWVNAGDYWSVKFDLTEKIKMEFDRNGISIPYPQRDIHMIAK